MMVSFSLTVTKVPYSYKTLIIREAASGVYGDLSVYLLKFSVNLERFSNKKLMKKNTSPSEDTKQKWWARVNRFI